MCDYTGVFMSQRYYIPFGTKNKKKRGCCATLPILFRALHDELGEFPEAFEAEKARILEFYRQPGAPISRALEEEEVPLDSDEFIQYLQEHQMGEAWLRVPLAQSIDDYLGSQKSKRKRAKRDGCI